MLRFIIRLPGLRLRTLSGISGLQWYQVMQFGAAMLTGVIMVKAGLSPAVISVYEGLMFISALFSHFWVIGGQNALLQVYPVLSPAVRGRAFFLVSAVFFLISLLTALLLILCQGILKYYFPDFLAVPPGEENLLNSHFPVIGWLAAYVFFNAPTFLVPVIYLLEEKYQQIVWYGLLSFSLQMALVGFPLLVGWGLPGVLWGLLIWAVLKFIWWVIVVKESAEFKLEQTLLRKYLRLTSPLIMLALIGKSIEYTGGLLVTFLFTDESAFAVYRYGARELPLSLLMMGALSTALLPGLVANHRAGMERMREATRYYAHFLYPISMLLMLSSPYLFDFFFSEAYRQSALIFNIFNLQLVNRIIMPQVVIMAWQKNNILNMAALAEWLMMLVLGWILGNIFGLPGIALAAFLAFLTERIILAGWIWHSQGISPSAYTDLRLILWYNAGLMVSFLLSLTMF